MEETGTKLDGWLLVPLMQIFPLHCGDRGLVSSPWQGGDPGTQPGYKIMCQLSRNRSNHQPGQDVKMRWIDETKLLTLEIIPEPRCRTEPEWKLLVAGADSGNWASVNQVTFRHPVDRSLLYCVIGDTAFDFQENRVNVVIVQRVPKTRIYQEAAEVWQMLHFWYTLNFRVTTVVTSI